jgi:hypothetical protein
LQEDLFVTFTDSGNVQVHYEYRVTSGSVIKDLKGTYTLDGTKLHIDLEQGENFYIQLGTIAPKFEGDWEVVPSEGKTLTIKNDEATIVFAVK